MWGCKKPIGSAKATCQKAHVSHKAVMQEVDGVWEITIRFHNHGGYRHAARSFTVEGRASPLSLAGSIKDVE
ncbi:MAG: hypothetical protein AMXMBFR20_35910 [Planctomycetia bacterium]|nr:MAG: hypothetical protein B6D36_13655 [Planctomycetes bacterium UTPLA1]